MSMQINERMYI